MTQPRLIALAASFRNDSLNRALIAEATPLAEAAGATVTSLDYASLECPAYRGTHDALPTGAQQFADALLAHDGILLACPEYNWSFPGSLKNLIDWLSVDDRAPLAGRTALLMCATPSARGGLMGLQQLSIPLAHLGMWVHPQLIGIGNAENKLVSDAVKTHNYLARAVTDFVRATGALRHAQ